MRPTEIMQVIMVGGQNSCGDDEEGNTAVLVMLRGHSCDVYCEGGHRCIDDDGGGHSFGDDNGGGGGHI